MSRLAELVRRVDPDRFLAALFAPTARRETLFTLCAFNHELARAREVASQPILALIRLQWWREVVQGARRRHDVAGPLGEALDRGELDAADLLAMIDGREIETEPEIPDVPSWLGYLDATAGSFAVAAGRLLGADAATLARLRLLGTAYGVAGQIANVAALASRERCMLPQDGLARHGLTAGHVLQDPASAGPLLSELALQGQRLLRDGQGRMSRSAVAAALPAVLARRDLRRRARHRGTADRLAVLKAAILCRI